MGSGLCTFEHWLQFASAGFASLAAIAWLWASRIKAPKQITEDQMRARYDTPIPALVQLLGLITRQSRMNAVAASFAGAAAICQIPQAFMPTCWSGSPWFLTH
jgi:hypothetical protein